MTSLPKQFFRELDSGGCLWGLEKPSLKELAAAKLQFPKLSEKYWAFVSEIGVGDAKDSGAGACLPYRLEGEETPSGFAVVCRPGASWVYCIREDGADTVYVFDYANQRIEYCELDFIAFIQSALDRAKVRETEQVVEMLERELLSAKTRAHPTRIAELLDEGFLEVGASGQYFNKTSVISSLQTETEFNFTMSVIQVKTLDPFSILIFYDLTVIPLTEEPRSSLRTSIWRRTDKWRMIWHQATVSASQIRKDKRKYL